MAYLNTEVSLQKHKLSNVSTNVPSKTYIRINYICTIINKGVVGFNCSKPALTLG